MNSPSDTDPGCDCYPGGFNPDTYEGPKEDCPVHGRGALPGDDNTRVYVDESTGAVREITADQLETLRVLSAANVTFNRTNVQVIDDILQAIMWASRWMFNTDEWGSPISQDYGPLREGENFLDLIQSLANDGADEIRKALLR